MEVAALVAVALILSVALPGPIQAKKKPTICVGKDGKNYAVGDSYVDNEGEACIRYKCAKSKGKFIMKKEKCDCNGGNHGISCCPNYVRGDMVGGSEIKITFSPNTENGCQNSCKVQHPTSIGVTQHDDGTSSCYCEFGSPIVGGSANVYKTCLFSTATSGILKTIKRIAAATTTTTAASTTSSTRSTSTMTTLATTKAGLMLNPVVLLTGGHGTTSGTRSSVEVFSLGQNGNCSKNLDDLPSIAPAPQSIHFFLGEIILCGGSRCLSMDENQRFIHHSYLNDGRSYSVGAVVNGKILIAGGFGNPFQMELWNGSKWVQSGKYNDLKEFEMDSCMAAISEDTILMAGGSYDRGYNFTNKMLKYKDGVWERMEDYPGVARRGHGCASIKTPEGDAFLIAGGTTRGNWYQRSCYLYNIEKRTWEKVGNLAKVRLGGKILNVGGRILIVGGSYGPVEVEEYDVYKKTWKTIPEKIKQERGQFAAVVVPGALVGCRPTQAELVCNVGEKYKDNCYLFVSARLDWLSASKDCIARNGTLATLNDPGTSAFVSNNVTNGTGAWIGANDRSTEGKWMWTTGEDFKFNDWGSGEPNNKRNEDCIVINWNDVDNWNDWDCANSAPYVCQGQKLSHAAGDGEWSAWSKFSACSATCGDATKTRSRTCSNPSPSNGGKPCTGLDKEVVSCDLSTCGFNMSATCDDVMWLFADRDLLVGNSSDWRVTSEVHIPTCTKVIEIHCLDSWIHGGILASSDNGLITDGAWNCSSDNRTTWNPAYLLGRNGRTAPDISPEAIWIWTDMSHWMQTDHRRHTKAICKIELETSQCPEPVCPPFGELTPTTISTPTTTPAPTTTPTIPKPGFNLTATCDNEMKLFVDGNLLATSSNWRDTSRVNIPADTEALEIHCMDTGTVGGILASSDNGLLTNGSWNCSSDNGTTWNPAYEVGPNSGAVPDISPEAEWIWTGCIGDWTSKYTGKKYQKNIICKIDLKPVIDGGWSQWSAFSVCNASCGDATKTRTQTCSNPFPENGGEPCHGLEEEVVSCGVDPCGGDSCPYIDKYMDCSKWKNHCESGQWEHCMKENCPKTCNCTVDMCTGDFYENGRPPAGTKCIEKNNKMCYMESGRWGKSWCYTEVGGWGAECVRCSDPINGNWGPWSSCSKSCIGGKRTRTCTNPVPKNGGKPCTGESTEDCNNDIECGPRFEGCVNKWCLQRGTNEQYTRCEEARDGGDTCVNPQVKYGTTEGGIPATWTHNDYDAWCKQIFNGEDTGSVTVGPRDCSTPKGKLFWSSGFDESNPKWCDWKDGFWKNSTLDMNSECSSAIASLTCRKDITSITTTTVLVMGPVPWTVLNVTDFSQLSSNSTIQDPGITRNDAYGSVSKVIDGTLYLCDMKACRSHNGLEWKIEEGMNLIQKRSFPADALILNPQLKWIVHGEFIPTVDAWTPQSGKWIKDTNYKSPYPVDLGCIVIIEGKILQVGGRGRQRIDGSYYTKRVFFDDVEVASLKEKRIYHHCTIFENRVWVAGGVVRGEHSVNLHKDVEIYDYKTDTWTAGPSFPDEIADRVPKLKVIQGDLYYIGSYSGKIFKLSNGIWKKVADNIPTNNKFIAEVVEISL